MMRLDGASSWITYIYNLKHVQCTLCTDCMAFFLHSIFPMLSSSHIHNPRSVQCFHICLHFFWFRSQSSIFCFVLSFCFVFFSLSLPVAFDWRYILNGSRCVYVFSVVISETKKSNSEKERNKEIKSNIDKWAEKIDFRRF